MVIGIGNQLNLSPTFGGGVFTYKDNRPPTNKFACLGFHPPPGVETICL